MGPDGPAAYKDYYSQVGHRDIQRKRLDRGDYSDHPNEVARVDEDVDEQLVGDVVGEGGGHEDVRHSEAGQEDVRFRPESGRRTDSDQGQDVSGDSDENDGNQDGALDHDRQLSLGRMSMVIVRGGDRESADVPLNRVR